MQALASGNHELGYQGSSSAEQGLYAPVKIRIGKANRKIGQKSFATLPAYGSKAAKHYAISKAGQRAARKRKRARRGYPPHYVPPPPFPHPAPFPTQFLTRGAVRPSLDPELVRTRLRGALGRKKFFRKPERALGEYTAFAAPVYFPGTVYSRESMKGFLGSDGQVARFGGISANAGNSSSAGQHVINPVDIDL